MDVEESSWVECHNLCLWYPNGWCEPILDIYISRALWWYKELQFNEFRFLKLFFENSRVYRNSNSQNGNSFGSAEVHSFTFSYTPESIRCDFQAFFLARTFASPCIGHEFKAKVATIKFLITISIFHNKQYLTCYPYNKC